MPRESLGESAPTRPDVYRAALERIRDNLGKVCPEYELCQHVGCEQSYTAWVVADSALREGTDAAS